MWTAFRASCRRYDAAVSTGKHKGIKRQERTSNVRKCGGGRQRERMPDYHVVRWHLETLEGIKRDKEISETNWHFVYWQSKVFLRRPMESRDMGKGQEILNE